MTTLTVGSKIECPDCKKEMTSVGEDQYECLTCGENQEKSEMLYAFCLIGALLTACFFAFYGKSFFNYLFPG